jgi:hypothetical protein
MARRATSIIPLIIRIVERFIISGIRSPFKV